MPRPSVASVTVLATLLGAVACAGADDAAGSSTSDVKAAEARVLAGASLPLAEVSGLGRRRVAGGAQYLAIGDASSSIVTFDADAQGRLSNVVATDVASVVGRHAPQWEAVAGDGEGRVFLLSETDRTVEVLDAALTKRLHVFHLDGVASGEGLVLLANGHLLVANEKGPTELLELAPEGAEAEGYRPALALGERAFSLPTGAESTLRVVKAWTYKRSDERALADVSDLAVDAAGRLVLLGDQARVVVRVEDDLRADEDRLDVEALHALPKRVDKPEGLVFVGDVALVASDVPDARDESVFAVAF